MAQRGPLKKKKRGDTASPASAQHLAARLAQARNRKQVKGLYPKGTQMNYAKKLGQKMVKARQGGHTAPAGLRADFRSSRSRTNINNPMNLPPGVGSRTLIGEPPGTSRGGGGRQPGYHAPSGRGGKYNGPWQGASSGPAAPGSSMGFGKGYKQTYAESHVHGKPRQSLRRYRRNKRIQAEYANARVT